MVFNTPFNTISAISWRPVLLGFELTTLVVIGTDCTGSCKSTYHTTTTTLGTLLNATYKVNMSGEKQKHKTVRAEI